MWSSMPKDEFERLSDLKKEHEQIDLLILQEQTRTRFIKDAQAKAEAKRKLLDREIVMAGDLLDSAKSQRSLLLEYQIQLTETQRILEKEVSQAEAEYARIVSVCDAKKSEWTTKMNDFQKMYDESVENVWSKYPGFHDYIQAIERRDDLRQQLRSAKVAHNQTSVVRGAANTRLDDLQKKKANLDALKEQLRELNERKNALANLKNELEGEKCRREEEAVRRQQEELEKKEKEAEAARRQNQQEEADAARVQQERNDAEKSLVEDEQHDSGINETNMNWTLPAASIEETAAMVSAMTKTSVVEVPKQTSTFLSIGEQIGRSKIHHYSPRKVTDQSFAESTPMDFALRLSRRPMSIVPSDVTPIAKTALVTSTFHQLSSIQSPADKRNEFCLQKTPKKNPEVLLKLTPRPGRAGFFKAPEAPPPRRLEKRTLLPPKNLLAAMESNHKMSDNGVIPQKKSGQPLRQKPRGNAEIFNYGPGLPSLENGRKQAEDTQNSRINSRKEVGQSRQVLASNSLIGVSAWGEAEGPARQPPGADPTSTNRSGSWPAAALGRDGPTNAVQRRARIENISSNTAEDAQTSTADPIADVIAWQEAEDSSQQPRPKVMKLGSSSSFSSFDPDFGNETGSDVFGNRRLLSNTSMFYDGDVENDAAMNGEETNQSKYDADEDGGFSFNSSDDEDKFGSSFEEFNL